MVRRYNLISLTVSVIVSGFIQYFLYSYNYNSISASEFLFGVFISLFFIIGSFLSKKGFLVSLVFLPFVALVIYSETFFPVYRTSPSFFMTLLIMIAMVITVWVFVFNVRGQNDPDQKKTGAKNLKNEMVEVLRELEYLETP